MTLDDLYAEYKSQEAIGREAFDELVKRFNEGRNQTYIEAAACSAAVMGLRLGEGFDPSDLSPELLEAFQLAFPNLDIADVSKYSGEQLEGLLQPWKGKLFEISVRDRLNNGEWVGDYHLDAGQYSELAKSATQPGWDLQISNPDGSVADLIQLKATNYIGYVEAARDRYPEYDVLSTAELASRQADVAGLSVTDIADVDLESQLAQAVGWDDFGLLGLGLPLIPLMLNVYWFATGERSLGGAASSVAISTTAITAGHVLGELAADAVNDFAGDMLIDGAASLLLDATIGFGVFTIAKFLWNRFSGASEEKARKQAERYARAQAKAKQLERLAIDSTCRHIDERLETTSKALENMARSYLLPAPATG